MQKNAKTTSTSIYFGCKDTTKKSKMQENVYFLSAKVNENVYFLCS